MNMRLTLKFPRLICCILAIACLLPGTAAKPDEPDKAATTAVDTMLGKKAGEVRDDNGLKMKLVWCPPGIFTMEQVETIEEPATVEEPATNDDVDQDEPKEKPVPRKTQKTTLVKVFLTRGYWLGKHEVTQSEWKLVMATEPWKVQDLTKEGDEFPATSVSWEDAMEFCGKLTERERKTGRLTDDWEYTLPTEAQWERACRARTESLFSFGDDEPRLGEYAWFFGNAMRAGERYAHRVGQKKPNPWGLYDMHGNVSELCRDCYAEKLPGGRDPETTAGASTRVFRGGGWGCRSSLCLSAIRGRISPDLRSSYYGFRVALGAVQPVK